jgi:hypothetical protein
MIRIRNMRGRMGKRKWKEGEDKKEDLTSLDEIERRIKGAFIEVSVNSSRVAKVKENYELQGKRVMREKPKGYEGLIEKYAQRTEECDRAVKELSERNEDLKGSLEEINLLKMSLKKEKVIDVEGRITGIKDRLDEIISRVEIYEEFPSDEVG